MMTSVILQAGMRLLLPLMFMFSIFLLSRGHNLPGGGFIGGLVASAGIALHLVAMGPGITRRAFPFRFRRLLPVGLLLSLMSGVPGLLIHGSFLQGVWTTVAMPGLGEVKLGTPLLFDLGVYIVVIGFSLEILISIAEEEAWHQS